MAVRTIRLNVSLSDLGKVREEIEKTLIPIPGGVLAEIPDSEFKTGKRPQCSSNPSLKCDPAEMPKGFCAGCADRAKQP